MNYQIQEMQPEDWEQVRAIYLEGIRTGNATFETEAPTWENWDRGHIQVPRLVARSTDSKIMGWAALSPYSGRHVYRGVAELGIYIGHDYRGQGIGSGLLNALIEKAENAGFWTLQAGILKENIASRQLHAQAGFREVGYREKIGRLNGVWRDVILMERRSLVNGVE